ncbi:aromatic amino acid lyase [Peribacillus frigoritolerans]|nr:aromatic amino acid lyase [Peribacillus frigoritolerans]
MKDAAVSIENEMNSVSDNPLIFPEEEDGIGMMAGNFDGSFVGIYADAISIALANLAKNNRTQNRSPCKPSPSVNYLIS